MKLRIGANVAGTGIATVGVDAVGHDDFSGSLYLIHHIGFPTPPDPRPMKPSTELHDLIKSLTKSEKRFFKLHSSLQAGDKNYLRLFEAVDRQKTYDEEAIKKQFAKETFIKHLPSEKNHLYKLVLKALRAYHAESSVSGLLKQEIKNIEILYDKALYAECNKLLHRAKKMAQDNERFYYWFELLSWEKMLLEEAYESGVFTKDLDVLIEEEREVIEKLRNLAAYHILYSKINYVFRSGGYVRTEQEHAMVAEISDHPLIKGKNTALSRSAATICYYTQGFCHWARRDWSTSLEKFKRVKQILDDNPLIKADLPKRYIRALHYIINAQVELHQLDRARENIRYMRSLSGEKGFTGQNIDTQIFVASYLSELRLLDRAGEYEQALDLVDAVLTGMEAAGSRLQKEHELEFFFQLACVHFGAGQTNKALFWLNKVLNDNEPALRQDIFTYARLFNLVVHYELGNYDLLEYIVRSTQRFLSKRQRAHAVEVVLIEHVKKLARAGSAELRRSHFLSLKEKLNALFEDPNEGLVLKYFDVMAWVTARLENVPFAEVVKRGVKKRR
jgi:tetratricopeptide (TPR) repeat protein